MNNESTKTFPASQIKLTEKERIILSRIATSEFHGGPPSTEPVWSVCENRSDNAIIGSLVAKGLVYTHAQEEPHDCQGLTKAGLEFYNQGGAK